MASTTAAGQPVEGFNEQREEEVRISGVGKYQKKAKGKKEHICIKRLLLRFLTTIRHGFLIAERYVKWFDLRETLVYVLFWTGYYERKGEGQAYDNSQAQVDTDVRGHISS